MKKAVVQYRFHDILQPPNDESGSIPLFLANYLLANLDKGQITHVGPYSGPEGHLCDLEDGEGTFIDILLRLDEKFLDGPADWHPEINKAVRDVLEKSEFILDDQMRCLNERFFVIEPYMNQSIH